MRNLLADQFSSTGEFYKKLTGTQPITPSSTATTVASSTTESSPKILGFVVLGILVIMRRRQPHTVKR